MNKKQNKEMRLNDEQTKRLLKLGLHDSEVATHHDPTNQRQERLSDLLSSKLPADKMLMKELPILVKSLSDELEAISGLSVSDCLSNPETTPAVLRRVKDFARDAGRSAHDKTCGEVAKAIYFAAIAAALVFHGAKISGHSYHDLQHSFDLCGQQDWIPVDLARLFVKAKTLCDHRGVLSKGDQ